MMLALIRTEKATPATAAARGGASDRVSAAVDGVVIGERVVEHPEPDEVVRLRMPSDCFSRVSSALSNCHRCRLARIGWKIFDRAVRLSPPGREPGPKFEGFSCNWRARMPGGWAPCRSPYFPASPQETPIRAL